MDNQTIVHKVEEARAADSFGMVTKNALQDQLKTFTANDWKQASVIYSKSNAAPDGFYITDDNGHVKIHNDTRAAHNIADNSVTHTTIDDAKTIGAAVVALDALSAVSWSATMASETWAAAGSGSGVGLFSAEVLGAGATALESAALYGGAVLGTIGAAVVGGDFVRNYFRRGRAQDEIRSSSEISFYKS